MMVSDYEEMQPQLATKARNDAVPFPVRTLYPIRSRMPRLLNGDLKQLPAHSKVTPWYVRLSDPLMFRLSL